jgi:FKBP-type peptidyl-prolyl cis-trans isomerase
MISKTSSLFTISFPRALALAAVAVSGLLLSACNKAEKQTPATSEPAPRESVVAASADLSTDEQKVVYGIGYNIGSDLVQKIGFKIDHEALNAGLTDALSSVPSQVEDAELQAAVVVVQQRLMAIMAEEAKEKIAVGTEYLAKNKTREGVMETASGLQYEVISSGTGAKPKATDNVVVHYHGTLMDGTVFDSSVDRGEPTGFPVNRVIPGWTEALQLMSVGDKWKLYVPTNLGYGQQVGPNIPAYSLLIFEVELLNIVEPKPAAPTVETPESDPKPQAE